MNEPEYHEQWKSSSQNILNQPDVLAIETGRISTNPSYVFIAGYQAAIRATFPELNEQGWIAYAASEDRSKESPKPGVVSRDGCLFGFKTWVAACNQINALVVKVGRGPDAFYAHLGNLLADKNGNSATKRPNGLTISSKLDPRFLPDMSQGIAQFENTPFQTITDVSRVKLFGRYEPYYIYISFLSSLIGNQPSLANMASDILASHPNHDTLPELDLAIQALILKINDENIGVALAGEKWAVDQRLYTMYSPMIQKSYSTE